MESVSLQSKLEALLFMSGEPIAHARLAELLDIKLADLKAVISALSERYVRELDSGLMLIEHAGKVEMATKPIHATLVDAFTKATLQETLSKAALEVLSIIAYRAPIARHEIEAIRGVNCSYTLRALLIRGLIERQGNPEDARGYIYRPSFRFLEHMGLARIEELPDYATLATDERMHVVTPTAVQDTPLSSDHAT
ncbi:MAG: SMC-Scp complex subunit ScpB [Candidatus Moraniibacteriota bacterium]|nr:MAG: SMC-Scp complex subunit ScpB [Candidatus Moranbacteria bacterium]